MFSSLLAAGSPAFKAQRDAQLSLVSEMSRQWFGGIQKISELNFQTVRAVMEESMATASQLATARNYFDALSIATAQTQPSTDKLQAYRQHVRNIVAETQAGMKQAAQAQLPDATRAAQAVVREVVQKAAEETAKAT